MDEPCNQTPTVLIRGIRYDVLDEREGRLIVGRPDGGKRYHARRLPDSPLFGSERATITGAPLGCACDYCRMMGV